MFLTLNERQRDILRDYDEGRYAGFADVVQVSQAEAGDPVLWFILCGLVGGDAADHPLHGLQDLIICQTALQRVRAARTAQSLH